MDEQEFKERCKRLKQVNKVIADLDPAIRESAYKALERYVTGRAPARKQSGGVKADKGDKGAGNDLDREEFFTAFDHDKPSDNVMLIVAWLYREYGTAPFTKQDIKDLADDVGLTVPNRIDATLKAAKFETKGCFSRPARGQFKPTVHGERRLKTVYDVKKGTNKRPVEDDA